MLHAITATMYGDLVLEATPSASQHQHHQQLHATTATMRNTITCIWSLAVLAQVCCQPSTAMAAVPQRQTG
eukprot:1088929-Lingulodinium_polyedra.AAC.1